MKLEKAKVILEENGYELLEEGKLGRALATGALALGSLFGLANATPKNIEGFNTDSTLVEVNQDELDRRIEFEIKLDDEVPNKLYYDTENDNWYNCNFDKTKPTCTIYHKEKTSVYKADVIYNENGTIKK